MKKDMLKRRFQELGEGVVSLWDSPKKVLWLWSTLAFVCWSLSVNEYFEACVIHHLRSKVDENIELGYSTSVAKQKSRVSQIGRCYLTTSQWFVLLSTAGFSDFEGYFVLTNPCGRMLSWRQRRAKGQPSLLSVSSGSNRACFNCKEFTWWAFDGADARSRGEILDSNYSLRLEYCPLRTSGKNGNAPNSLA